MIDVETLEFRANVLRKIQDFFFERGYLQVDTPSLSHSAIPESCLEVFKTDYVFPFDNRAIPLYLLPSPELYMKKLISAHKRSIFQICHSFRNCEALGKIHNVEFTMLEYYSMGFSYRESLSLTEELFARLIENCGIDASSAQNLAPPFVKITCDEAFFKATGTRLSAAQEKDELLKIARQFDLQAQTDWDWASIYDLIFVSQIEPNLDALADARGKPVALFDYPAQCDCLAQSCENPMWRERWELYARGIELANCYSEETFATKALEFFKREAEKKRKSSRVQHEIDFEWCKIFDDFPKCSGVAMGCDRLIAALLGRETIDGVIPFCDLK